MDALTQYSGPGNTRELENVIERAVILSPGPTLRVPIRDLHTRIVPGHNLERSQTLEEVERKHIMTTLKETRWVHSGPRGAATRLGLNRATLYFRMKKLGIVRPGTVLDLWNNRERDDSEWAFGYISGQIQNLLIPVLPALVANSLCLAQEKGTMRTRGV
jgi:hypothetical protein